MLIIKSTLTTALLTLTSFFAAAQYSLTVHFQYQTEPLCYWDVELRRGTVVWGSGTTDENGDITFNDLKSIKDNFDIHGKKNTSEGNKAWTVTSYMKHDRWASNQFKDKTEIFKDFKHEYDMSWAFWGLKLNSYEAEIAWGTAKQFNDCTQKPEPVGEAEKETSLTEDIRDMRSLQQELSAARQADLTQQNSALKQKIERLNQRVTKTRSEVTGLEPGTMEHSNKSYDLRDLELELEMAELELDRNLDEQSNGGGVDRSDRQRYNAREDILKDEQKQLAENRKNGFLYGQTSKSTKAVNQSSEEKAVEEEDASFKIFTAEELANMSNFDLKRNQVSNKTSINRREIKLKTNAAFLDIDKKAKIQEEITALEKQVEAIKTILDQRNQKE